MKKTKAYWLRYWHLMYHAFRLKDIHMGFSQGTSTLFCGIPIRYKAKIIACTCGKVWYNENNKK